MIQSTSVLTFTQYKYIRFSLTFYDIYTPPLTVPYIFSYTVVPFTMKHVCYWVNSSVSTLRTYFLEINQYRQTMYEFDQKAISQKLLLLFLKFLE